MDTNWQTGSDSDTSQAHRIEPPATALANQGFIQRPPNSNNPTPTPNHQQATDMIEAAHEMIREVRQTSESSPHAPTLEARLAMLESCMIRFGDDQQRIAETMRRLEMGMSRQTPEQQPEASSQSRHQSTMLSGQHRNMPELSATDNTYTHTHTNVVNTTDRKTGCPAARESPAAEHQQPDRSVRFGNTPYLHNTPMRSNSRRWYRMTTYVQRDTRCRSSKEQRPRTRYGLYTKQSRYYTKHASIGQVGRTSSNRS